MSVIPIKKAKEAGKEGRIWAKEGRGGEGGEREGIRVGGKGNGGRGRQREGRGKPQPSIEELCKQ